VRDCGEIEETAMKLWTKLLIPVLAIGLVGGLVGIVDAKGNKNNTGIKGKIVSVTGNGKITIMTHGKKGTGGQTMTITTDVNTTVEVDGMAGKAVRDLSSGQKVVIQGGTTGPATDIQATSKHKGKRKNL
jgi:hypothetical protein